MYSPLTKLLAALTDQYRMTPADGELMAPRRGAAHPRGARRRRREASCQHSRRGMLGYMVAAEGRSPRPQGGDPNVKMMRVSLTPEEWRKLRVWAAEENSSMQRVVGDIVRRALVHKPRRTL